MLTEVTVFLIVVLIGYALLSNLNSFRPRLEGLSNYAVLFESAIYGGLIFVALWFSMRSIDEVVTICSCGKDFVEYRSSLQAFFSFTQSDVLLLTGIVVLATLLIGNRRRTKDEIRVEIARESGLIPQLILDAVDERCLVQVTTARRKVYIGWIWMGPSITDRGQINDFAIMPMQSGYRDRATHEVYLKTDYREALRHYLYEPTTQGLLSKRDLEVRRREMSVVVPVGEITLIRRYIDNLSELFHDLLRNSSGKFRSATLHLDL